MPDKSAHKFYMLRDIGGDNKLTGHEKQNPSFLIK